jgi:hypothetical protein
MLGGRNAANVGALVHGATVVRETNRMAEMRALDALPTEVRREIYNARFPLSSIGLEGLVAEHGIAAVVRAVRLTDEKIAAAARQERGLA